MKSGIHKTGFFLSKPFNTITRKHSKLGGGTEMGKMCGLGQSRTDDLSLPRQTFWRPRMER